MTEPILSDQDFAELVRAFHGESEENLARIEEVLVQLEQDPRDRELLNDIFRAVHTIKGSGSCIGYRALSAFAHGFEERLQALRSGELEVSPGLITALLRGVDVLHGLAKSPTAVTDELSPQHYAVLQQVEEVMGGATTTDTPRFDGAATQLRARDTRALRVSAGKLDRMVDLIGEIAVARGHIRQLVEDDSDRERILDSVRDLDRLSAELQEAVMTVRLVPIGPALRFIHRVVRDLAAREGKLVEVSVEGEEVELDMNLVEHIRDPLTHMVRNAVDHGIEDPQARAAAGKPATAHIRISVVRDASGIVVRVADDGKGLDESKIASRAQSLGMVTDRLTRSEIQSLIFEPGFSTADEVSDVSGRGVGMDIVRRNVESVRGSVSIESVAGAGMTITIRLPLTLAVIDGFAVGAADETYIIPIDSVLECVDSPAGIDRDSLFGIMELRGAALPWVRLRRLFGIDNIASARESVVIVQNERGRAGLIVDRLYGSQQTVMKPLSRFLCHVPGIAGSSILGSGRVALIVDVSELLRLVSTHSQSTEFERSLAS
ncbi:MAG TPA: chemotaxis protein CheA [Thermoanaerobaculia bacterium]|nr:chemotaxis protein CheA [Thermoanaerobaculia bacterium]